VTDASNSSKPALKSHQAAVDAHRAAEAQKAAEVDAQQAANAAVNSPLEPSPTSLSRSSSQAIPCQTTSGTQVTQSVSSDDELEEQHVRPPKGKRKAIGTPVHVHTIRSLMSVLLLVDADTLSEPSTNGESIGRQKKTRKKRQRRKNKPGLPGGGAPSEDGIFSDIELTGISSQPRARREDASRDIREFFDDSFTTTDTGGKTRQYRNCKICS
jgi:hypothetical protein